MNSNVDNVVLRKGQTKCRLKAVWRKFPNFKLCSPQLARRKRDNASTVNVRAPKTETAINDSLEVAIDDSLEVVIGSSLEVAINDLLETTIDDSLEATINKISPSDKLPIFPLDELPISPLDELPILPSEELPILPLDELPILPLDELPIKNNKLKNRNSRVKYRERRKKNPALQMAGNPTSNPDNNPLTAAPSPSTTTSCPQACDGTLPPMTAMTLPTITAATLPPTTTATGTTLNSTKVKFATDLLWVRKRRASDVATADRKSPPELEHPFKTIPANPELANQLVVIAKKLFKTNTIKVVLDDAGYSHRLPTNDSALFSSWPRADNDHVVTSSDEVRPVVNMTKDQILRAGLRTEGTRTRVCVTYAFLGVLTVALTADAKSAPPLIADLVPGHNQTKEFDKKLDSTRIDTGKEFAKP